MHPVRTLCLALLGLACQSVYAATIASAAPASGYTTVAPNYLGEAFTVSGTGSYNSIAFDFLTPAGAQYAIGTGFVLSQAYTGAPSSLSSATAGYLGLSMASANVYSFDSSLALNAGSTYYFYENALAPTGAVGGAPVSGATPQDYYALSGGNFTAQPGFTLAFQVTGNAVTTTGVTPEPSSLVLLATGALAVAGIMRRRLFA